MTDAPARRVGYREVLRDREVRGLLASDALSVVGDQVARIAVALLVLERSGSAFAAAATYSLSYLSWMLGGPVLSALSDRYPRRRVMVLSDVVRAALVAVLAVPGLPLWTVFTVLLLVGLLAPPAESARSAMLADVVDGEPYVVANAMGNAVAQGGQVVGFVAGGALVAALGVEAALLADAATFVLSAVLLSATLRERQAERGEDDPLGNPLAEVRSGVRLVTRDPRLRTLLAWGLLTAVCVIPAEGLAVAVTEELGGDALAAGLLTASIPAGFLVGSWLVLRLPAERREGLFGAMVALSAVCLMVSPLVESLPALIVLWTVAGIGNALQLVANSSFVRAVPGAVRGRAFGVAGTALMAVQGIALLGAGALAEAVDPRVAVAVVAAACLVLVPVLVPASQGPGQLRRGTA